MESRQSPEAAEIAELRATVESLWSAGGWQQRPEAKEAAARALDLLDRGAIRVASPPAEAPAAAGAAGDWTVHAWVKQAILMFFGTAPMAEIDGGALRWFDKVPTRKDFSEIGVRAVPSAVVRRGAFVERGAVLMPSYVNIGAWVGARTMVDTWATVGSCAQVGRDVHLSGGVGIGGVLEPPQAAPVVIEDGCFVGSRAIVVEGVRVEREAVIGAGVVLTASTPILDVTGEREIELRGRVPPRSVVIPGTREKRFPAGSYGVPCALIIGRRKESTDKKTSLNEVLRDFAVPV
jgi:2,3,4,5-tetrahydropyridine-2-carboxylate N-succinyltransferase